MSCAMLMAGSGAEEQWRTLDTRVVEWCACILCEVVLVLLQRAPCQWLLHGCCTGCALGRCGHEPQLHESAMGTTSVAAA